MRTKNWAVRCAAAMSVFGAGAVASAAPIVFDPDGLGGLAGNIADVAAFDWAPGNVLARGGNQAIANFISSGGTDQTPFTAYYQAKLSALLDSNTNPINVPGLGTQFEITVIARFNEFVDTASAGATTAIAGFGNSPSPDSYFEIYAHPIGALPQANDLGGFGFNDGIRILAGTPTITTSGFTENRLAPDVPLDNSPLNLAGNDNYPGLLTVTGAGGTELTAIIDPASVNTDYFKVIPGSMTLAFEGSQKVQFNSVDPSSRFVLQNGGTALGGVPMTAGAGEFVDAIPGPGELGTVNGEGLLVPGTRGGPSIQLQADGNSPISAINLAVPEPATAMLGLMGIAGLALRRRRNA